MSVITVENLSKIYPVAVKEPGLKGAVNHFFKRNYRYVNAVKDVTFYIDSGEIVGFLGANGAGKTTTLKMLTGLIHPSEGRVRVAGYQPFRRQHSFLKQMSLVMGQKQQLLWDLPAIDSLKINAAVYQISDAEFRHRVGEFSEMLALEGKLSKPIRKLSLGERMKAELLAALLHYPQVLFLDEPTLGLDVNAQEAVREFLREYNQRHQATILLTSHYMADITALCERVILMHEGSLFYDGGLDELVEQFAPYREVIVEFAEHLPEEKLVQYGELEGLEGREARFIIRREDLTQTTAKLLTQLEVVDLKVSDPPIEEIIGRLFRQGGFKQ
jgi:ABC-2 type transport system ATP-binding protein